MANQLLATARASFLAAGINWGSDTIKVCLIDTSLYTFNIAHDFLNDVAAGAIKATATLGSKTGTAGVADAADAVFSAVAGGATISGIMIYKDTGSTATSPLIAWFDTATNLPIATNGGDITIAWNASGIFAL